ncbi:MAG: PepSY-like domain-containing protein [Bernardetiaceae bacterium]
MQRNLFKFLSYLLAFWMALGLTACDDFFDDDDAYHCGYESDKDDLLVNPADLPRAILDFVQANYPDLTIIRAVYDRDDRYYEVWLSNGIEIYFDESGNFLKIDD